jgi:hypothetical protein
MIHLTAQLFFAPLIVFAIVATGYSLLLNRVANRLFFRKFMITLLSIGFSANLIWELLHSHLYQGYVNNTQHVLISALASVADALMVLLLYVGFAFIFKNPFWIQSLTLKHVVLPILAGAAGGILSEMVHVARGDWHYAPAMPIIPFLNVGLSPTLQFMIVPLATYLLSFYLLKPKTPGGN